MKRILSLALVLVMLVSVMPMALADKPTNPDGEARLTVNAPATVAAGATSTPVTIATFASGLGTDIKEGAKLTLESSNKAIADISGTSVVGVAPGTVTITATGRYESKSFIHTGSTTFDITVTDGTNPLVLLPAANTTTAIGDATGLALRATLNGDTVDATWSIVSGGTGDGTISGGFFKGTRAGTVTLKAEYTDGTNTYSNTTTVVVTGYTVAIDATATVNYASTTPVTLEATVTRPDGSAVTNPGANLTWYVETNDYITIDAATGKITVKKAPADSVTVKAYAKYTNAGVEYVSNDCVVTVSANDFYIDQKPVNHSGTGSVTLNPALKAFNAGTTVPSNVKFTCEVSGATVDGMTIKSNSLGLFNVTITATWEGGKLSTVVPVSFYGEYDFGVTANKTKFHLEEDNVLTDWKSGSSYLTPYNNQSVYDVLVGLSSNAAYVRLWTSSSSTASGKLSSTSFIDYETKGTLLYASKLSPITFEQIVGRTGDAIIYFELGNTTTDSSNYVVVGKGSINVAFGESKSDIVYNTSKEKAVSVNENDFYKFYYTYGGTGTLSYVEFGVDSNVPDQGALYTSNTTSTQKYVTAVMDFYYDYNSTKHSGSNDWDLDAVTYVPNKNAVKSYSTKIPFTCYSTTGATLSGILEFKVGDLNFTDVKTTDYFYDAVVWAVNNGVTSGTSATTFSPNKTCSRAEVVTFLWRAAGEPKPTSTYMPFSDVKVTDYYYDAVRWAVEEKVTTGTSATTFSPNATVTRGQVVTFLFRALKASRVSTANPFTDVKSGEYYYDAVLWAVKNDVTNGLTATTFGPNTGCTRGQIVTFLYRAYEG